MAASTLTRSARTMRARVCRKVRTILAPVAASSTSHAAASGTLARVCVVGAGVVGLSSALRLARLLPLVEITVVAEKFGTDTTTAGAAGLWGPYALSGTPDALVAKWSSETFENLIKLNFSEHAWNAGVHLASVYSLHKEPEPEPFWKDLVLGYRGLTARELTMFGGRHAAGVFYTSATCEGRYYLPWLTGQLREAGVQLEQRKLGSLQELEGYDVIINCSGLGAEHLVPDPACFPIRGQIIRVRAPWLKHSIQDAPYYLIPNREWVVLGGTTQVSDYNTSTSLDDKQRILGHWQAMLPALKDAEVISDWVGLRPGRSPLRLEAESVQMGGRSTLVVHNYGHGGSGLTIGWGCAGDAAEMVKQHLGA